MVDNPQECLTLFCTAELPITVHTNMHAFRQLPKAHFWNQFLLPLHSIIGRTFYIHFDFDLAIVQIPWERSVRGKTAHLEMK